MNKKNGLPTQAGFTLIMVFFIMAIMLSIVLSLTVILITQINSMKNFGNSVTAYYLTESGIEKTLYFDRKQIPDSAKRGLCNIPNICSEGNAFNNCDSFILTPLDTGGCDIATCTNCELSYKTNFDILGTKSYKIKALVTLKGDFSDTDIFSTGSFNGIHKTIQSHFSEDMLKSSRPVFTNYGVSPNSILAESGSEITIYATITDKIAITKVLANIKNADITNNLDPRYMNSIVKQSLVLNAVGTEGDYSAVWTGPKGVYYVDITAFNKDGKPTTVYINK